MPQTARERPILFSGPMIRAILADIKTNTRRIVKPQPAYPESFADCSVRMVGGEARWFVNGATEAFTRWQCPYGAPGDRLWVRETWCRYGSSVIYRANYSGDLTPISDGIGGPWKPSIFMPRELSRITLEITEVRVERLQEITEDDARAEGAPAAIAGQGDSGHIRTHRTGFIQLWNSINAKRAPWADDPFVWVLVVRRIA